ncbi:MAG: 3'-5' exonuclease [Pedobacter sp.]|nr:3'-5' exonuclease [Chitinophagaceae bacterium]
MNQYILFIDTETSDVPVDLSKPYSEPNNWPFAVQISWCIYTKAGKKVKEQSYFINNKDIHVSAGSQKIHGISKQTLRNYGISRKTVLQMLQNDVAQYKPLLVGHFLKLDYYIIGADAFREKMTNPLELLPTFCTMLATQHLVKNPRITFLKLCDLYDMLFNKPLINTHNALSDAMATANCFFELIRLKEITSFCQPPIATNQSEIIGKKSWLAASSIIIFITSLTT